MCLLPIYCIGVYMCLFVFFSEYEVPTLLMFIFLYQTQMSRLFYTARICDKEKNIFLYIYLFTFGRQMSILMKHLLNLQPCVITRCLRISPSILSVNVGDKQEAALM